MITKQPQLTIPSPAEQELDQVRSSLWREAGRSPQRLFTLIKQEAKEVEKEFTLKTANDSR